jgi:hypothetical protein
MMLGNMLSLLLMSLVSATGGVEIFDYLGRAVQDLINNSSAPRGKQS